MIGRQSDFGNPFVLKKDGGNHTRLESVEQYQSYFQRRDDLQKRALEELQGETLGCYCLGVSGKYDGSEPIENVRGRPTVCHGEVILQYINSNKD